MMAPLVELADTRGLSPLAEVRAGSSPAGGTILVHVDAPHFYAGIVVARDYGNGTVVDAAPILGWARGKPLADVLRYFKRKRWRAFVLAGDEERDL